jgi:hypothetical protein
MTTFKPLWDKPPHNTNKWVADISGVGRYLIQRREKGSREYVLKLNGRTTKYYGTVDELKKTVERIVSSTKT